MRVSNKLILSAGEKNGIYLGAERKFTMTDKRNLDENTKARHTHSNKEALERITEEYLENLELNENKVSEITEDNTNEKSYPSVKALVYYVSGLIKSVKEVVTEAIAKFVERGVRFVDKVTFKINSNEITEGTTVALGEGWSGTLSNGFTFSGRLASSKLIFDVTLDANSLYLIRFKMSKYAEGKVFVGIGNGYAYDVYMGGSQAIAILESDGGQPYIEVRSDNATFEATFTEMSCCKITDDGVEEFEIHPSSIYRGVDKPTIGTWNVIIGDKTTMGNNINGTRNIGIGAYAFRNFKTGTRNIGIGTYSLSGLKNGNRNIGIGADALFAAEEAQDNVVIGKSALTGKHLEGSKVERNICIGNGTLTDDNDGVIENTIIGHNAGKYARDKNVLIGFKAGYFSKGNGNVAIGHNSFTQSQQHEGDNNTIIGTEAQKSNDALNGIIAIGYKSKATKDNQCVLGGDNITETLLKGELLVRDTEGNIHKVYKEEDVMNYVTEREATYLNSLKGNISCETVNITDISPLTHNLKVTVTNESEVATTDLKVIKTGKNLASICKKIADATIDDAVLIKKGTYAFSVKEVNTTYDAWRLQFKLFNTDGTLVENTTETNIQSVGEYGSFFWYNSSGKRAGFYLATDDYFQMTSGCDIFKDFQFTITFNNDYYVVFSATNSNQSESNAIDLNVVDMQLESGNVATEYIPFTKPIEYSVTADGTIEGVTAIYPVTNLYTKTSGVTINAEYNRDINKVIENLQNAIISLGGNI